MTIYIKPQELIYLQIKNKVRGSYNRYISVSAKFYISHMFSLIWLLFSLWVSKKWIMDLGEVTSIPLALVIITGIAYIPGYMNSFLVSSLLLDRQPPFKHQQPTNDITVLIAARNEEKGIRDTLRQISYQEYEGIIHVLLIDNHSTDHTVQVAKDAAKEFGLSLQIIPEWNQGKHHALNKGLKYIKTEYMVTLDADTLLHRTALKFIVSRMLSAPKEVCSVAGTVLVRNSRDNMLSKLQEWDYFLSIASVKRLQGLYQQTLVAQGAFSLYKTEVVKEMGGWPDVIGEDIVLTWKCLKAGYKVYFEPLAVAFTTVPVSLTHFSKQRSRWARGMIEGLKTVKPWEQPSVFAKYLTGINFIMPFIDVSYTFFWLPGLILCFFGIFWIVGPLTLLVLPITFLSYFVLYQFQKSVFKSLGLRIRKNKLGFVLFVLGYQVMTSPIAVWGYLQEAFQLKRVWK